MFTSSHIYGLNGVCGEHVEKSLINFQVFGIILLTIVMQFSSALELIYPVQAQL